MTSSNAAKQGQDMPIGRYIVGLKDSSGWMLDKRFVTIEAAKAYLAELAKDFKRPVMDDTWGWS